VAAARLGVPGGLDRRWRGGSNVVLCPRALWWWSSPATVIRAAGGCCCGGAVRISTAEHGRAAHGGDGERSGTFPYPDGDDGSLGAAAQRRVRFGPNLGLRACRLILIGLAAASGQRPPRVDEDCSPHLGCCDAGWIQAFGVRPPRPICRPYGVRLVVVWARVCGRRGGGLGRWTVRVSLRRAT
jgi:hypothetical protein